MGFLDELLWKQIFVETNFWINFYGQSIALTHMSFIVAHVSDIATHLGKMITHVSTMATRMSNMIWGGYD